VLPDKTSIGALTSSILQPRVSEQQDMFSVDNRGDTWAVGVMALDLFTGHRLLHQESFMSKIQDRLVEFGKDPDNVAIGEVDDDGNPIDGALSGSTGSPQVDTLINSILRPRPQDRPDLQTILNNPLFSLPGVGSDEAGALILAIKGGNQEEIDLAAANLMLTMRAQQGEL
jgi:hypothetical protein